MSKSITALYLFSPATGICSEPRSHRRCSRRRHWDRSAAPWGTAVPPAPAPLRELSGTEAGDRAAKRHASRGEQFGPVLESPVIEPCRILYKSGSSNGQPPTCHFWLVIWSGVKSAFAAANRRKWPNNAKQLQVSAKRTHKQETTAQICKQQNDKGKTTSWQLEGPGNSKPTGGGEANGGKVESNLHLRGVAPKQSINLFVSSRLPLRPYDTACIGCGRFTPH